MRSKKLIWNRVLDEPFIKPCPGTVAPDAVTTPDVLVRESGLNLFIGAVDGDKEYIILVSLSPDDLKLGRSIVVPSSATTILHPGPSDFDCQHVFDPAVIQWQGKTFLYYSAIGKCEDSIGLAISDDGVNFNKQENALLIGRSPEVVAKDDLVYLFYVLNDGGKGYSIFASSSRDGISFKPVSPDPVLSQGILGEWDDMEVTTPRIIRIDDIYFMIYAGLDQNDEKDIPRAFGIARSKDLIHWEKYPMNPVFRIAGHNSWDDGAIWFGTLAYLDDNLYLIYEGGRLENILGRIPALTQVGLAKVSLENFRDSMVAWN